MQLPAAQYACVPLPIKASLERVYGTRDEFTLQVPPISFPISTKVGEITVVPKVRAKVSVEPDRVTIQSLSCEIDGSPAVQEWKLNDRYELDVCATLTWEKSNGILNLLEHGGSDNSPAPIKSSTSSSSVSTIVPSHLPFQEDIIRIKTDLAIDVYPPDIKRIQMIPKRLMAKVGNMVLKYVVGLLLEAFLQGLQQDYEQWASDPDYRKERQKLEVLLQQELKAMEQERQRQETRRLRQEQRELRRQQRLEDDSSPRGGGGGGLSFHNPMGFLQRGRRGVVAAAAAPSPATTTSAAATMRHPKLRRGERIIRLIRRNNHINNV